MAGKEQEDLQTLDELAAEADEIEAAAAEADAAEAAGDSDEIAALTAERDDFRDKFMRALADAENTRKRAERDRREAENYGGSRLARDLLPVYDNLRRALEAAKEARGSETAEDQAPDALTEGVELTMRELVNVFKKHGIDKIEPQVGDKFDPKQHQAMFEAPVPGTKAGEIIQVAAPGFMLHDRLLRAAQVGVSSMPAN